MRNQIRIIISVLAGTCMLMWYAWYNGYPLVTSDTGAYVRFSFDFQLPKDRSPFYSVFLAATNLRLFSFAGVRPTLWLPVYTQAALLAILLLKYYDLVARRQTGLREKLVFILLVALGTGASWVASFIMPDVFTPLLFLSGLLYVYDDTSGRGMRVFYLLLSGMAILVHNSHFLIFPMLLILLYLPAWLYQQRMARSRILHMLGITAGCWLLMCSLNGLKGLGWTLSPGAHVFLTGKLVETGVLKQYLDDNCAHEQLKLCAYKDELPELAYQYIWHDSPFQKIGGWDSSAAEHKKIIRKIFVSPHYTGLFAQAAFGQSVEQLCNVNINMTEPVFDKNASPYRNISTFVNGDIQQFDASAQQRKALNNKWLINIQFWLFVLSCAWILWLYRHIPHTRLLASIYLALLLYITCNAFVTATFANVLERLQNRVSWLLPATNIAVLIQFYFGKFASRLSVKNERGSDVSNK